jgi:predicted transglutaminase-like cysteine proteinase
MRYVCRENRPSQLIIIVTLIMALGTGAAQARSVRRWSGGNDYPTTTRRTMGLRDTDKQSVATLSWRDAARHSSSPEAIARVVKSRIQYSPDRYKEDEWRSGRETWERAGGDCEDYAAAVKDLCQKKGFESQIVVVRSKTAKAAHAVTIGECNGRIWVSSNGSYTQHASLSDAKQELARDLGWWSPEVEMFTVKESEEDGSRQYVKMVSNTRW